jgi:probable phosphoglycerate mutase
LIHEKFQCEFYFIRHGESASNSVPGFIAGVNFDSPLTDLGLDQARLLGERLKDEEVAFDRVYSSSLVRAVQTAETMLEAMGEGGRSFPKVDALIEQQMPGWRGARVEEVYTPELLAYMCAKASHFVPPDGESHRMVQRRTTGWLEQEIIYNEELVSKEQSLTVAIVGHGAATKCLLHYFMGFDERLITTMTLDNCSITRFTFSKDGWTPLCINDSSHINRKR